MPYFIFFRTTIREVNNLSKRFESFRVLNIEPYKTKEGEVVVIGDSHIMFDAFCWCKDEEWLKLKEHIGEFEV